MITLIFTTELPANADIAYVDFFNFDAVNTPRATKLDIEEVVYSEYGTWISDLERWHGELCEYMAKGFPDWWLYEGSRLIAWHPPIYRNLIFALAVRRVALTHHGSHIYVLNAPKEVVRILRGS